MDPVDPGSEMTIASGAAITSSSADGRRHAGWSPDGRLVAYSVERGDSTPSVHVSTTDGKSTLAYRKTGESPLVAWSPRSDAIAVEAPPGLVVVGVGGRVRSRIRTGGEVSAVTWSPDGVRLAFARSNDEGLVADLWVADAATGRARRLTRRGNTEILAWAPGPVPGSAPRARALPSTERAAATSLDVRGRVSELAASGRWVAAIVETNALDCTHVVAWRPGLRSPVRFETPAPCQVGTTADGYYQLRLTGRRLSWIDYHCALNCYTAGLAADVGRPGSYTLVTGDRSAGRRPLRLAAPSERHRGVTFSLTRGTIVLRRGGGTVRKLRPPGGATDAELEEAGLFYAFAQRGSARLVFVPFAGLFSR